MRFQSRSAACLLLLAAAALAAQRPAPKPTTAAEAPNRDTSYIDALPHAFWYDSKLPESIEANKLMAEFFVKQLGR